MLVHIVADYGAGDLAFAEVVQRIKLHLPDAEPVLVPVPPFCTVAAGSCIAQLGLHPAPPGTLIYHNVAPSRGRRGGPIRERGGTLGLCTASDRGPGDRGPFWLCPFLHQRRRGKASVGGVPRSRQPVPFTGHLSASRRGDCDGMSLSVGRRDRCARVATAPLLSDRLCRWLWKHQDHHRLQ